MKNTIGKYGLTGNSGLGVGGFFHIAAPYDCNGQVFVEYFDTKLGNYWWKRIDANQVKDGKEIIMCAKCRKVLAGSLDHYWPYYNDHTLCAECYKTVQTP